MRTKTVQYRLNGDDVVVAVGCRRTCVYRLFIHNPYFWMPKEKTFRTKEQHHIRFRHTGCNDEMPLNCTCSYIPILLFTTVSYEPSQCKAIHDVDTIVIASAIVRVNSNKVCLHSIAAGVALFQWSFDSFVASFRVHHFPFFVSFGNGSYQYVGNEDSKWNSEQNSSVCDKRMWCNSHFLRCHISAIFENCLSLLSKLIESESDWTTMCIHSGNNATIKAMPLCCV